MQGDAQIADWFKKFGIDTIQKEKGLLLKKAEDSNPEKLIQNFIESPDIAQTMACLCVAKKIPFHFFGLKTLKIKETDRVAALINELAKFGASLSEPKPGELKWDNNVNLISSSGVPTVETYSDHRMAMSFAPMAAAGFIMQIKDPQVVSKSYPAYWTDLKKAGFIISNEKE